MKVELDTRKNLHENAKRYYEEAKKYKAKLAGVRKAIQDTEKALNQARVTAIVTEQQAVRVKISRKREWFEKFHWFLTSDSKLVIAGRDAKQNELLVGKHFEDSDLFFHADVIGAPATILKDGMSASEQEKKEAAAFAAAYSSAWKQGLGSADVYAVKREQVSKAPESGEYLKKGGFIIRGTREWFRSTPLRLLIGKQDDHPIALPFNHSKPPTSRVTISPGQAARADVGQAIKSRLHLNNLEDVLPLLPGACRLD